MRGVIAPIGSRTVGLARSSGIYGIIHISSGKIYVGSATCLKTRIGSHRCKLRSNYHENGYLQNAWNKHGELAFDVTVLEICDRGDLLSKESDWMAKTRCCEQQFGFNLDKVASRKTHSEETKAKIAASNTGKRHTQESIDKMSRSHTGLKMPPRTDEYRKKISATSTGRLFSAATRLKMSAIHKGKTITENQKAKIRASLAVTFARRKALREALQMELCVGL